MNVVEFIAPKGKSPFSIWFNDLDPQAAAKIVTIIARLEYGNISNTKSVGSGVMEYRMDWGPGLRVYFGRDGETLIILLGGGTKRRQNKDIQEAIQNWSDYKLRKGQK
jgi:putative addiction module killer protein